MGNDYNMVTILVFLAIAVGIYFIPFWIAYGRKHHNIGSIMALNLFLGWTALGWLLALIWSLGAVRMELSENIERQLSASKKCPFCAETIKIEAKVCRYCSRDLPASSR